MILQHLFKVKYKQMGKMIKSSKEINFILLNLCNHSKMTIKNLSKYPKLLNHKIKVLYQSKINNKYTVKNFLKNNKFKVKKLLMKISKKFKKLRFYKKISIHKF